MADISKITLPSGDSYDLKDSIARPRGIEYIVGTQTAATGSWTGVTADDELYAGKTIAYKLPVASASGAVTLNLTLADGETTTGAIGVFMNNTTNVGTSYPVNSIVHMTYDGSNWRIADYYVSNSDTLAYAIRYAQVLFNSYTVLYRYQLLFTYNDTTLIPVNTVSNSTGTSKTLTTESFDPFGQIYYYNTTGTVNAGAAINTSYLWAMRHDVDMRYSFNTGTTLTAKKFIYLVCVPQSDGKVKLHTSPIAQDLPTTEDGLIYKLLGKAYNTSSIQMFYGKPCYYYKDGAIRLWTNPAATGQVQSDWNEADTTSASYIKNKPAIPGGTSTTPKMNGTAAVGSETTWAKGDHVHPTDTSRAPLISPALTGTPTAPTAAAGTNTTQIATTAFVKTEISSLDINPVVKVNCGTFSSLPITVNSSMITADMELIHAEIGSINAQTGDWTVTTANGSVTVSGTITGSTTLILYLCVPVVAS